MRFRNIGFLALAIAMLPLPGRAALNGGLPDKTWPPNCGSKARAIVDAFNRAHQEHGSCEIPTNAPAEGPLVANAPISYRVEISCEGRTYSYDSSSKMTEEQGCVTSVEAASTGLIPH
jgi:hypothetical protein